MGRGPKGLEGGLEGLLEGSWVRAGQHPEPAGPGGEGGGLGLGAVSGLGEAPGVGHQGKLGWGGARGGARGRDSVASFRCSRMRRMTAGSVMTDTKWRRPLQRGQARTSTAKTRRNSSAQEKRLRGAGAVDGGSAHRLEPARRDVGSGTTP